MAARDSDTGADMTDAEIDEALEHEVWDLDYPTLKPI
jgi:hypothetical protein